MAKVMDESCRTILDAVHLSVRDALGKQGAGSRIGVAFSGGVDSTLLATVCDAMGYDVELLTVGFEGSHDVEFARVVASEMPRMRERHHILTIGDTPDFGDAYESVLDVVHTDNLSWIENSVAFYHICRLARTIPVDTVLAANGIDELFCGYDAYRRALCECSEIGDAAAGNDTTVGNGVVGSDAAASDGRSSPAGANSTDYDVAAARGPAQISSSAADVIHEIMRQKIDNELRMMRAIDRVASLCGVSVLQPLLSRRFCRIAYGIPLSEKIRGPRDMHRKHVIRRLASEIGVPRASWQKRKKAMQYGSGIHKAVLRIRKRSAA